MQNTYSLTNQNHYDVTYVHVIVMMLSPHRTKTAPQRNLGFLVQSDFAQIFVSKRVSHNSSTILQSRYSLTVDFIVTR